MIIGTSGRMAFALARNSRPGRLCKLHRELIVAEITPELLAEQNLDIRLIINHENEHVHHRSPDLTGDTPPRGRTILNSVHSPGRVSTSIDPPCCLTMMSWLMDRPNPVPSPAGFVVKNGLNIFSFTSAGIPVPLSRMRISTLSPRFFVAAVSGGSKPSPASALRFVAA